jgi:hypothetical protein
MLVSNGEKELEHKMKCSGTGLGSVVVLLLAVSRSSKTTSAVSTSCAIHHRNVSIIARVDTYANYYTSGINYSWVSLISTSMKHSYSREANSGSDN